jgi:hypothetical protein
MLTDELHLKLREVLVRRLGGIRTSTDITAWAADALAEGVDTPSLRILAGLRLLDSPFELEHYLALTLEELGIDADREALVRQRAADLAREIQSGHVLASEGACKIAQLAARFGYPDELDAWRQLSAEYAEPGDCLDAAILAEAAALAERLSS